MPANKLETVIHSCDIVVCRSGYSSIMDLAKLGKKAIFIPTPSQTEQEYLAAYFSAQKICFSEKQSKFDLKIALQESNNYKGFEASSNKMDLPAIGLV